MTESKVYIPELWEPKLADKLDNYAHKSDLNNFILKNANINMSDHLIENVKNGRSTDAVNKSYVDNLIKSVNSNIPYMTFIKETVSGSDKPAKTISRSIENAIFNGLKPENIVYSVKGEYTATLETILKFSAILVSITNNIVNFKIRIRNEMNTSWEQTVVVYLYLTIFHEMVTSDIVQNDQPSRELNELDEQDIYTNTRASNIAKSYF